MLEQLEALQTRAESVLKLCTTLESKLPARLHWTLRAWRSSTTSHSEKLASTLALLKSVLNFEDTRESTDISATNLASALKFYEVSTQFRILTENAAKEQAYLTYLSAQAEYHHIISSIGFF